MLARVVPSCLSRHMRVSSRQQPLFTQSRGGGEDMWEAFERCVSSCLSSQACAGVDNATGKHTTLTSNSGSSTGEDHGKCAILQQTLTSPHPHYGRPRARVGVSRLQVRASTALTRRRRADRCTHPCAVGKRATTQCPRQLSRATMRSPLVVSYVCLGRQPEPLAVHALGWWLGDKPVPATAVKSNHA
eukprot:159946-Chlamydomonas_euryale.AAC.5